MTGKRQSEMKMVTESTKLFCRQELKKNYSDIKKIFRKYVDLDESYYEIIALWLIGTFAHKEFKTYPYLFLNAMRGSGKTRLLKLLESMCWNGKLTNSPTESFIFRNASKGTILLDELERIGGKDQAALRELLNSGYKKGSKVPRMRKIVVKNGNNSSEEQITEYFELFTPLAMANIWGMEEVLGDRCIGLVLEKSANSAITLLIEDFDENPEIIIVKESLSLIRENLLAIIKEEKIMGGWNEFVEAIHHPTHHSHTNTTIHNYTLIFNKIYKSGIDGRNLELFFPILILANIIDPEIFDNILDIAKLMVKERREDEYRSSRDVAVYEFISNRKQGIAQYFNVSDLTKSFKDYLGDEDSDNINSIWFGKALRRLKLIRAKRRLGRGNEVQLNIEKACEKIKMFKPVDSQGGV